MKLHRGDVWNVRFDPQVGEEIGKTRPAVIVSDDKVGILHVKMVVPITEWKTHFVDYSWFVRLTFGASSGLSKESAADCYQLKSVSEQRFAGRLGKLRDQDMQRIVESIMICVGGTL